MKSLEGMNVEYKNWVPVKMIMAPFLIALACAALAIKFWAAAIAAVLFLGIAGYFFFAWYRFSPRGGNIQKQIESLVLQHLHWDGKGSALDIGCGNGPLTIALAQQCPQAKVTGVDTWGKSWDYSQKMCEHNAEIEGVGERVVFSQGSAADLPFGDNQFDLVVSNLVFHEIRELKDKREGVRQALRVLKPGGIFVLQDLFLIEAYYGKPDELLETVHQWGIHQVEFIRTCDEPFIPKFLKLPFMVGTIGILVGIK